MTKRFSRGTGSASAALAGLCVAGAAVLLAACSGAPMLSSATPASAAMNTQQERAYDLSTQVLRSAMAAKPARRQITPQDILREWSTLPRERQTLAARGRPSPVPGAQGADVPATHIAISDLLRNPDCDVCEGLPFHQHVASASQTYGVPPALIHAVIQIESSYNPRATSHRQARGLMQITPAAGRAVGVSEGRRLYDPKTNIDAGTAYLQYLMRQHATVDEVLAAYNAGIGNVRRYGGVPPFQETRKYVRNVKSAMKSMAGGDAARRTSPLPAQAAVNPDLDWGSGR
ncbi:Transglycosylase SLT domain-containing protein [Noviherbaspirillum humi]|uniref:Transglycosylase SLT domain-containing protein n=1 Tax=Noviherbaspirillum humi TaxID=1688639 RepID=A0A239I2H2_9BURK|nr:lytic transglycosylase domain-containing protein [Noviherbaspirillum humi]SNS87681.1 Transglycosylase SLT domain-containing protein [Noviherbaspirillum humi]